MGGVFDFMKTRKSIFETVGNHSVLKLFVDEINEWIEISFEQIIARAVAYRYYNENFEKIETNIDHMIRSRKTEKALLRKRILQKYENSVRNQGKSRKSRG